MAASEPVIAAAKNHYQQDHVIFVILSAAKRSEESRIFKRLRSFATLRMTEKRVLKWLAKPTPNEFS
jgi:hypothetical protein